MNKESLKLQTTYFKKKDLVGTRGAHTSLATACIYTIPTAPVVIGSGYSRGWELCLSPSVSGYGSIAWICLIPFGWYCVLPQLPLQLSSLTAWSVRSLLLSAFQTISSQRQSASQLSYCGICLIVLLLSPHHPLALQNSVFSPSPNRNPSFSGFSSQMQVLHPFSCNSYPFSGPFLTTDSWITVARPAAPRHRKEWPRISSHV